MKISPQTLFRVAILATLAAAATSCVQLRPADREFKAHAVYEPEEFAGQPATAEEALNRIPKDPDFQQLEFDRTLDPRLLQAPGGPYRVGPGDILDIEVAENESTRRKTKVMPDGMLYYDVASGVNVKGHTLQEISTRLSKLLDGDYVNPVVSVNVATADSQRFWMLGQVRTPGAYPIRKPTTVVDALSQGGGLLSNSDDSEVGNPEAADLERAILIRDGDLVPVDFESLIREGNMSQNVYVRGGDYIFVPSLTTRSIYVLGEVIRPGPVSYESGATLLTAVSAAGGVDKDAVGSKALILRGGTHRPKVAVVNVNAVMRGKQPDLRLEGGDIVWVPRTPWTKLNEYVEAVLITAGQAVAVQEGLGVLGTSGSAGVTITAGGN
jgi:protein involved in polysaccharide export with SLBB domain